MTTLMVKLDLLKSDDPINLLLIENEPHYLKVLITWKRLKPQINEAILTENPTLDDFWRACEFDFSAWGSLARIKIHELRKTFEFLKMNSMIYPDGTLSSSLDAYISRLLLGSLERSPIPAVKNTADASDVKKQKGKKRKREFRRTI